MIKSTEIINDSYEMELFTVINGNSTTNKLMNPKKLNLTMRNLRKLLQKQSSNEKSILAHVEDVRNYLSQMEEVFQL